MGCDMCGSEGKLFRANVEGAMMTVCSNCSKYGEVISKVEKNIPVKKVEVSDRPEIITMVRKNYPALVKSGREKKGLTQDEMAQRLGEKSSMIHQIETGHMKPSMKLARKLEGFLKIKLVEEYEEKKEYEKSKSSDPMTIGDMISID